MNLSLMIKKAYEKFNLILSKHKTIIISISLFLIVFGFLGIPFKNWWFYGADDSHGLYVGYKTKTFGDCLDFFIKDGDPGQGSGPSNVEKTEIGSKNFLGVYYRPLYCVYLAIQYWLFGTNGYCYHLCNVFFHAINTVLLFYIFTWLINLLPAFLAALMFAFHPQIAYRFGAIVNLHYYINVMLLLLIFIFFKKYIDTKKWYFNLISCILFATSLFTRETSIVLPGIIFLGLYLYPEKYHFLSLKNFLLQTLDNIHKIWGLIYVALSFLLLRLYLYPIKFAPISATKISIFQHLKKIFNRFPEFQVFVYDSLSMSWLPWGHKTIRGIILISIVSFLFYLSIKSTKKIYILYFITSALIMLWPAYLVNYNSRYIYESYPFILLAFIFLFKYTQINVPEIKKIAALNLTALIVFLIVFTFENFSIREKKMEIMSHAIYELLKNPEIKNRALCFFGYPLESWGEQNADIFWILLDNPKQQMLFDSSTAITQMDSNLIQVTKWKNIIANLFDKNYLKITPIKNGFRFQSLNPEKIYFEPIEHSGYSLGKKTINKKINFKNLEIVTDFSLIIDQKYLDLDPLFIKWDYEKKKFIII